MWSSSRWSHDLGGLTSRHEEASEMPAEACTKRIHRLWKVTKKIVMFKSGYTCVGMRACEHDLILTCPCWFEIDSVRRPLKYISGIRVLVCGYQRYSRIFPEKVKSSNAASFVKNMCMLHYEFLLQEYILLIWASIIFLQLKHYKISMTKCECRRMC